jgi:hypothetical protein
VRITPPGRAFSNSATDAVAAIIIDVPGLPNCDSQGPSKNITVNVDIANSSLVISGSRKLSYFIDGKDVSYDASKTSLPNAHLMTDDMSMPDLGRWDGIFKLRASIPLVHFEYGKEWLIKNGILYVYLHDHLQSGDDNSEVEVDEAV